MSKVALYTGKLRCWTECHRASKRQMDEALWNNNVSYEGIWRKIGKLLGMFSRSRYWECHENISIVMTIYVFDHRLLARARSASTLSSLDASSAFWPVIGTTTPSRPLTTSIAL